MSSTQFTRLYNTLEAGKVSRYHAVPTVRPQTVGQHSWGVAVLLWHITQGQASAQCLMEAIMHDTAELFTGDIPFTVKRDHPAIKEAFKILETHHRVCHLVIPGNNLSDAEEALLKVCDTLEGFIWCKLHEDTRGPVGDRWEEAYHVAQSKFKTMLTEEQWNLADEVFYGFLRMPYNRNSTNA